jgi:pimeloyl-ACP methyl ester carboxylesterase
MARLIKLLLAAIPIAALVVATNPAAAEVAACTAVQAPTVPGARVLTVTAVERHDYVVPPGMTNPEPITDIPAFCEVVVTLTHPGAGDVVTVEAWLPLTTWNGRFQGTGGGGYAPGFFDQALAPAVKQGYAATSTDAGVGSDPLTPTWALTDDGAVNRELLTNFASRSLHDMAVAGKALTAGFYGRPATYAYWTGCSTGGRQGLMSAQRYPDDYDGIVAAAPAINWTKFVVAEQWPQVVMAEANNYPTPCELQAFADAAVTECDRADKVPDGVIGDPTRCEYDPYRLVGTTILCDGRPITISPSDAAVVARIWAGPGVWSGLPKGTPFWGVAGTTPDGTAGTPFPVADNWIKYFLKRDPTFDTSTLTFGDWYRLFAQSIAEYRAVIDTSDPNLSAFRAAGGKMITWHGQADEVIFPAGSTKYWQQVPRANDFYRLFMAPGVGHCGGGRGAAPTDPLAAVVAWVEQGRAPNTLPAATPTSTKNLCPYPKVSRYDGKGNPNDASSYRCAHSY